MTTAPGSQARCPSQHVAMAKQWISMLRRRIATGVVWTLNGKPAAVLMLRLLKGAAGAPESIAASTSIGYSSTASMAEQ